MIPIARGQAMTMKTWPPSRVVHACWLDDAEHDDGLVVVVAACGDYAAPEEVRETDAAVDCMTCLARHRRYDQDLDESA